jgi:hypothetical protein
VAAAEVVAAHRSRELLLLQQMRLQAEGVGLQHCRLTPAPLQLLLRQRTQRAGQHRQAAAVHGLAWLQVLPLILLQGAVWRQACVAL